MEKIPLVCVTRSAVRIQSSVQCILNICKLPYVLNMTKIKKEEAVNGTDKIIFVNKLEAERHLEVDQTGNILHCYFN